MKKKILLMSVLAVFMLLIISFVSSAGDFFGLTTSLNDGVVFVQTLEQTYPFTTTWEKLGFFPWFNILIGALLVFFFLPRPKRIGKYILGFILLSGIFLILRYVLVMFVFTQTEDVRLLWDPVFLSISFIPFALLLMRFAPLKSLDFNFDRFKEFRLNKSRAIAMVLVFLFVFSFVGAFVFQDPGSEKNETSIAVVEIGTGKIVVVVDSYTFNDNVMGGTFTEPDDNLRQIYNLEYYIFEELLLT